MIKLTHDRGKPWTIKNYGFVVTSNRKQPTLDIYLGRQTFSVSLKRYK